MSETFRRPGTLHIARERWRRRYWSPGPDLATYDALLPLVVITGGSEGIGLALAGEFAKTGHDLLLVARSADTLAAAASQLASTGATIHTLAADLATPQGCQAVEAELASLNAYCDILINNAATGLSGPFAGQPPDDLTRLADLNMRAVTDLTRRFLPGMLERGQGGVLNVASLGGLVPGPNQAAYYASKAYVISLTRALAHECAGQGLRISALLPGPVATPFHARMSAEHSYYLGVMGVMSPEQVARAGFRGFQSGRTLIFPGVINHLNAAALRVIPSSFIVPVLGWLLKRR